MGKFTFLKSYFSPFKPIKPILYIGGIKVGTPYFLPRKWKSFDGYRKAFPKKIGFDFVSLGWKTKWEHDDIRFEWNPIWSFVFIKWQICLIFAPKEQSKYWEAWVYYEYYTDKNLSKKDRISQCINKFPRTFIKYSNDTEETIDYYPLILKSKYIGENKNQ